MVMYVLQSIVVALELSRD